MSEASVNIVNVVGGLGNQLFQYFFGVCLEEATGIKTYYDTSDFTKYNKHGGFGLDKIFSNPIVIVDEKIQKKVPLEVRSLTLKKIINRVPIAHLLLNNIVQDTGISVFDKVACKSYGGKYYLGLWQAIEYTELQTQFFSSYSCIRLDVLNSCQEYIFDHDVDLEHSAAVHVRLGDYLDSVHTWHLPLDESYYRKIIDQLMVDNKVGKVYVFSDNIHKIKSIWFRDLPVVFVEAYPGQSGITDMFLISRFQNIIISASTFGWWAAMFAPAAQVYAPSPWVRPKFVTRPRYSTYLPSRWIKCDSAGHDLALSMNLTGCRAVPFAEARKAK